jgi:hypothetical protein
MTLIIAIGALIVASFAALVSVRQLWEARKANVFPAVVTLFSQYREPEMIRARRALSQGLSEIEQPCAIHDLPDDVARAPLEVANYLENVGLLMQLDLIDPRIVVGFMGGSAERIWDELAAFIALERESRPEGLYLEYFEHLAATIRELRPMEVRSELRKLPHPTQMLAG